MELKITAFYFCPDSLSSGEFNVLHGVKVKSITDMKHNLIIHRNTALLICHSLSGALIGTTLITIP